MLRISFIFMALFAAAPALAQEVTDVTREDWIAKWPVLAIILISVVSFSTWVTFRIAKRAREAAWEEELRNQQ